MRFSRGVFALLCLCAVGTVAACPVAPASTAGSSAGAACSTDLDCADALFCSCGTCAAAGDDDVPPACTVQPPGCPVTAADCYAACGDVAVLAPAACVDGVETCEPVGGTLLDDCPDDTCWGAANPGQVCRDGAYICALGEANSGGCITDDCVDDRTTRCVRDCSDAAAPQLPVCVASALRCDDPAFSIDLATCATCPGVRPQCLKDCDSAQATSSALCDEGIHDWRCVAVGTTRSDRCVPDAGISAPDAGAEGGEGEGE